MDRTLGVNLSDSVGDGASGIAAWLPSREETEKFWGVDKARRRRRWTNHWTEEQFKEHWEKVEQRRIRLRGPRVSRMRLAVRVVNFTLTRARQLPVRLGREIWEYLCLWFDPSWLSCTLRDAWGWAWRWDRDIVWENDGACWDWFK